MPTLSPVWVMPVTVSSAQNNSYAKGLLQILGSRPFYIPGLALEGWVF